MLDVVNGKNSLGGVAMTCACFGYHRLVSVVEIVGMQSHIMVRSLGGYLLMLVKMEAPAFNVVHKEHTALVVCMYILTPSIFNCHSRFLRNNFD